MCKDKQVLVAQLSTVVIQPYRQKYPFINAIVTAAIFIGSPSVGNIHLLTQSSFSTARNMPSRIRPVALRCRHISKRFIQTTMEAVWSFSRLTDLPSVGFFTQDR